MFEMFETNPILHCTTFLYSYSVYAMGSCLVPKRPYLINLFRHDVVKHNAKIEEKRKLNQV